MNARKRNRPAASRPGSCGACSRSPRSKDRRSGNRSRARAPWSGARSSDVEFSVWPSLRGAFPHNAAVSGAHGASSAVMSGSGVEWHRTSQTERTSCRRRYRDGYRFDAICPLAGIALHLHVPDPGHRRRKGAPPFPGCRHLGGECERRRRGGAAQSSRYTRSRRSWRSCASSDRVAIGRASRRRRLIGSPVSSQ